MDGINTQEHLQDENVHLLTEKKSWPWHGWLGIALALLFWYLNWNLDGLRTHWGFFPMWLGYILTVDAWVYVRTNGHSILARNFKMFISLFIVSAPFWWLFELIDLRTDYWIYTARHLFTDIEYFTFATICFCTVIPAVFETTELVNSFFKDKSMRISFKVSEKSLTTWFIAGIVMLVLTLWVPQYSAAFLWISLYLIFDIINYKLGYPSLMRQATQGRWKTIICLAIGCVICGFFWEMWNYYSNPKWIYNVPFVDFWHLFEMPALGYLGYIPFAWEVYALYHLVTGLIYGRKEMVLEMDE